MSEAKTEIRNMKIELMEKVLQANNQAKDSKSTISKLQDAMDDLQESLFSKLQNYTLFSEHDALQTTIQTKYTTKQELEQT